MRQPEFWVQLAPQKFGLILSVVMSYRWPPVTKEMTAERIGPDFAGIAGAMSITSCPAKFGPVLTAVVSHR